MSCAPTGPLATSIAACDAAHFGSLSAAVCGRRRIASSASSARTSAATPAGSGDGRFDPDDTRDPAGEDP